MHDDRKFSGTVLIAIDGKIVFEKSVGFSNIEKRKPFQQNSSVRLASVSKQFTAMGIMILHDARKLNFDDDITKYLTELPYKGITIRHLLNHTAGYLTTWISALSIGTPRIPLPKKKVVTNKDVVTLMAKHHPKREFAPGDEYSYSNTGYAVLGSIIEKVSGESIQDFFKGQSFCAAQDEQLSCL